MGYNKKFQNEIKETLVELINDESEKLFKNRKELM